MIQGIELLRAKRGDEKVSFNDIADHLVQFHELFPDETDTVHRIAAFLAKIDDKPHTHT